MRTKFLPIGFMAVFFWCLTINAFSQGGNLPLNGSVNGKIAANATDSWQVTTTTDGLLQFTITSNDPNYYVNAALYDNNGTTVLSNVGTSSPGSNVVVNIDGLAAGTYYVKVFAYSAPQTPAYTLSNAFTTAPVANDVEPNNSRNQAALLKLNDSITGHVGYYYNNHRDSTDWYKVTTTTDGLLRLKITTLPSLLNAYINCTLYDNNGIIVLNSNTTGGATSTTLSSDGLAAGTYYIQMSQYNNTNFVSYKLADSLFASPVANDLEPDSTPALALTLPLNGSVTGHVGYYYDNHRDSVDWYKVTTSSDGLLRLKVTTEPSTINAYINYALYDNNGKTLLNSNTTGAATSTILITDGLAEGTYYVKMSQYNNTDYVSYKLADSLFAPPVANDVEPDSTRALALTLPLNGSMTGHVGYYYNNHRDSTDWYKVTIPTDGLLRLKVTTEPSTLNAYVNYTLYDNNGITVLNSSTTGAATSTVLGTDGLAAGTYYVKISQYNSGDYVSYKVDDSLFTYTYAADTAYEPNGKAYLANTILSNHTTTGHFGFLYDNVRDSTDWFKINYTGTSGNLNLTINLLPHLINGAVNYMNFYVYKDTSVAAVYQNTFGNTSNVVNLTGLSQGYYYLRITQYNTNDFEAYSIADSFMQVNKAQISLSAIDSSTNTCGSNKLTYNLSGSHSPYTVRLFRDGVQVDSLMTTATTAGFMNLSAGHYYATVYGDGATDSAYSKSVTTILLPPHPTGLFTTNIGVHTATLNWGPVSCVQHYVIYYKITGSTTWTMTNTAKNITGNYMVGGLVPYTKYTWQIASIDSTEDLMSKFSDTSNFTTLSDTAHIVLVHAGQGKTCNSDTLQYTTSNSAAPYTVQLYRNGLVYGSALMVTATATFYSLPSGNYYATATGTGSGGSLGKSATTQFTPPVPTGLDSTDISAHTATLSWNDLGCVNYYTLQYRLSGSDTWTSINTAKNSIALSGLTFDETYEWRVASIDSSNRQIIMSAYSVTATFRTHAALPVTLTNFDGVLQNGNALLSWSTATEINNKGFELQKSMDGQVFTDIGFVAGNGNSSLVHNYNYTDIDVLSGSNYYRLKQIDLDGRFTYSSIIKLDYAKFAWTILGNPVGSNSMVQVQIDKTSEVIIEVVSMNGSVIRTINKGKISAGTYSIPLHLGQVSSGIYVVRLILDEKSYSKEIFK